MKTKTDGKSSKFNLFKKITALGNQNASKTESEPNSANNQANSPIKIILKNKQNPLLYIIILLLIGLLLFGAKSVANNNTKHRFTSALVEALELDELATSELVYNGIATVNHPDSENPKYFIRYNSIIKVGVHMNDIHFDVEPDNKLVNILLPEIKVLEVIVDPGTFDFIPDNFSPDVKTAVTDSKNDAMLKASQTHALSESATENLKTIVEALTLPLIQGEGYKIAWQESGKEQ